MAEVLSPSPSPYPKNQDCVTASPMKMSCEICLFTNDWNLFTCEKKIMLKLDVCTNN